METLTAQHCLAIAATFIAIIAACATLITSTNSKAESLSTRIREAAKEHRERRNNARCIQLQEEIILFQERFRRIQRAQRLLFSTIGLFITGLTAFIGLGLYITYFNIIDASRLHEVSRSPIILVGICVGLGAGLMLAAIYLQFLEIGASYATLCIETSDCERGEGVASSLLVAIVE
jgi:Flp pilus assembly protein TadB